MIDQLKALCAAREKAAQGEWFAGTPGDEESRNCGLCQVDDGLQHGMYAITCEWHEGRFIALAANLDYPRLIAMVERYEEALRFYAYADCRPPIPDDEPMRDSGKRAREALAKETP